MELNERCTRPLILRDEMVRARDDMEIDAICLANTLLDPDKFSSQEYFLAEYRVSRAWHLVVHELYTRRGQK